MSRSDHKSSPDGAADREILDAMAARLDDELDLHELQRRFPGREARVAALFRVAMQCRDIETRIAGRDRFVGTLARGSQVGEFEIEYCIGKGGMGTVYRAKQRSLGNRPVALKVLSLAGAGDSDRDRFRDEAKTAASLHHANLAEVYGLWTNEDTLVYAMELVEGPSLVEVLLRLDDRRGSRVDRETTRLIVHRVREVASALALVHERRAVHGDVKPANVLLRGDDGSAVPARSSVLIDFGLARAMGAAGEARPASFAAEEYAAPEALAGRPLDARSDVYGLGITLHELLTGNRLGPDCTRLAGLRPDARTGVDRDLLAIVSNAVARNSDARYKDAGRLEADLDAWLAGRSVTARPGRMGNAMSRWIRLHRWRLLRLVGATAATGFLLAMVVSGLAWTLMARHEARSAAAAFEQGDLIVGTRALREVPAFLSGIVLPPELEEVSAALMGGGKHESLVDVLLVLEDRGVEEALTLAAAYLERDGLDAHPWLATQLARTLSSNVHGTSADDPLRSQALLLTVLLFFDRPDRTPDAPALTSPFREGLLAFLDADSPGGESQELLTLAALGGCGTPRELESILAFAERRQAGTETRRLATASMARIVRRSRSCKLDEWFGSGEGIAFLQRSWSLAREDLESPTLGLAASSEWHPFFLAVAFVLRFHDIDAEAFGFHWEAFGPQEQLQLLCAMGQAEHPLVVEALQSGEGLVDLRNQTELWGLSCGFLGDPILTEAASMKIEELHGRGGVALRRFNEDLAKGREEREFGRKRDFEPDADSQLGALLEPGGEMRELPTHLVAADEQPPLAGWGFGAESVGLYGDATGARASGGVRFVSTDSRGKNNHWRLARFGTATLVLEFELSRKPEGRDYWLKIRHLAASRPFLPHGGSAHLEIELDGHVIDGDLAVSRDGYHDVPIAIDRGFMSAGRHALKVRLAQATTTYWLRDVRIEAE